jgi:hypothetical protein
MKQVLSYIVIGILVAATGFFGVKQCSTNNKLKASLTYSAGLKKQLDAPPKWSVKEIHDTIFMPILLHNTQPDSIVYVPVLLNSDCDSVKKDYYAKKYYSGSFDRNFIHGLYGARVSQNRLDSLYFPRLIVSHTDSTGIRIVDTCLFHAPQYKPMNHLGMDINLIGNSISKFPNFDAVLFWSIKDYVKINVGGEYNMYHGQAYAKIGFGIYFR